MSKSPDAAKRVTTPRDVARVVEVDDVRGRTLHGERRHVREHEQLDERQDDDLHEATRGRAITCSTSARANATSAAREARDRAAARSLEPHLERPRAGGEQHERHRGEHERLAPEVDEPDALQHDAARDEHEPARRDDDREPLQRPSACSRSER